MGSETASVGEGIREVADAMHHMGENKRKQLHESLAQVSAKLVMLESKEETLSNSVGTLMERIRNANIEGLSQAMQLTSEKLLKRFKEETDRVAESCESKVAECRKRYEMLPSCSEQTQMPLDDIVSRCVSVVSSTIDSRIEKQNALVEKVVQRLMNKTAEAEGGLESLIKQMETLSARHGNSVKELQDLRSWYNVVLTGFGTVAVIAIGVAVYHSKQTGNSAPRARN